MQKGMGHEEKEVRQEVVLTRTQQQALRDLLRNLNGSYLLLKSFLHELSRTDHSRVT